MAWPTKWLAVFLSAFFLGNLSYAEMQAPVFSKKKITLGKKTLEVEIAETQEQQSYGLMFRKSLPEDYGMLFVFERSEIRSFWMKNTYVDLSLGYYDQKKILFQIIDMKATSVLEKSPPSYPSSKPAQFALEVPKGWFHKHGVKLGDKFEWR